VRAGDIVIWPEPFLVGRNAEKLRALSQTLAIYPGPPIWMRFYPIPNTQSISMLKLPNAASNPSRKPSRRVSISTVRSPRRPPRKRRWNYLDWPNRPG
jgi:hypothetical protein